MGQSIQAIVGSPDEPAQPPRRSWRNGQSTKQIDKGPDYRSTTGRRPDGSLASCVAPTPCEAQPAPLDRRIHTGSVQVGSQAKIGATVSQ